MNTDENTTTPAEATPPELHTTEPSTSTPATHDEGGDPPPPQVDEPTRTKPREDWEELPGDNIGNRLPGKGPPDDIGNRKHGGPRPAAPAARLRSTARRGRRRLEQQRRELLQTPPPRLPLVRRAR